MWFALLLACPDEGQNCDTMAVYSVTVTVTDEAGAPVQGATMTYSLDGGVSRPCEELPEGTYACGVEEAGNFEILVLADGFELGGVEVDVGEGECHVLATTATVVLEAEAECTDTETVAVILTVESEAGTELTGTAVDWRNAEVETASWSPCTVNNGKWYCGWEQIGLTELRAVADGHDEASTKVEVPADDAGCHPVPQYATLTLPVAAQ